MGVARATCEGWVLEYLKWVPVTIRCEPKPSWVANAPPATVPSPQLDGTVPVAPGSSTVDELCQHGILSLKRSLTRVQIMSAFEIDISPRC